MSKQNGNKGRRFDRAFKEEAVRLLQTSGRRQRQIAGDLGISVSALGRWVTELREEDLLSGPHEDAAKEITRLRRERDLARQERDLLKKALAFFVDEVPVHRRGEGRVGDAIPAVQTAAGQRLRLLGPIQEKWRRPTPFAFCLEFDGACEVQRRVPTDWVPSMYPAMAVSAWLLDMNTVLHVLT